MTRGFSMVEIMVAVGILAMAFLPIIQYTSSSVQQAGFSQEEILARHYLMDLMERFKGSPLDELRVFPSSGPATPLGRENEQIRLQNDSMLSDQERIIRAMEAARGATGQVDPGEGGIRLFLDLARTMKLTRVVTFETLKPMTADQPGMYRLTCAIRWHSRLNDQEKRVEFSKLLVRNPPALTGSG